jgi:hypothetical protein
VPIFFMPHHKMVTVRVSLIHWLPPTSGAMISLD